MSISRVSKVALSVSAALFMFGCNSSSSDSNPNTGVVSPEVNVLKYVDPFIGTGLTVTPSQVRLCQKAWCNCHQIRS